MSDLRAVYGDGLSTDGAVVAESIAELRDALKALAAVAQQPTSLSSVELGQTAKGATQVSVKVYSANPRGAAHEAQALYDELVAKYRQEATP